MDSEFIFVGKECFQKMLQLAEFEFNCKNLIYPETYMDAFLSSIGCKWIVSERQPHFVITLQIIDKKKWVLGRLKYNL